MKLNQDTEVGIIQEIERKISEHSLELNELFAKLTESIRIKTKDKMGALPVFSTDEDLADSLSMVSRDVQLRWIKLYADVNWIKKELLKADTWNRSQPRKKKNISRFLTNWLSNSFNTKALESVNPKDVVAKNWFESWCLERGFLDTGLFLKAKAVNDLFGGQDGFAQWFGDLQTAPGWKALKEQAEKRRYLTSALTMEITRRKEDKRLAAKP